MIFNTIKEFTDKFKICPFCNVDTSYSISGSEGKAKYSESKGILKFKTGTINCNNNTFTFKNNTNFNGYLFTVNIFCKNESCISNFRINSCVLKFHNDILEIDDVITHRSSFVLLDDKMYVIENNYVKNKSIIVIPKGDEHFNYDSDKIITSNLKLDYYNSKSILNKIKMVSVLS